MNFTGLVNDLSKAKEGSLVLMHACSHNVNLKYLSIIIIIILFELKNNIKIFFSLNK